MSVEEPTSGPLQIVILGFETTENFRGDIARELLDLRGRGLLRVLDARLFHRSPENDLTEVDLGPLIADRPADRGNPVAKLLGVNGGGGNGGMPAPEAFSRTAGFALEDLRRLTSEIGPGEHAVGVLVEHRWATRLLETVRAAGGRLLAQGFLTREVAMVIGAELQVHADAEAAIELANAARGAALLEALALLGGDEPGSPEARAHAAAEVVRVLAAEGFIEESEEHAAIDALATAGLIEVATLEAAVAEAEEMLEQLSNEPPAADPD